MNKNITKGELVFLFVILIVYIGLLIPFIKSVPYLDGNIDFVKTYDFFSGGFDNLLANWNSIHPPTKEILFSIIYKLFGINTISYNLPGIIFGIVGINYFYFFIKNISNIKVAKESTLLFAFSPLFISTGIFSLTDYLLTIFIIISLYYYIKGSYLKYALTSSLTVLTKESGLLLIISVLAVEVVLYLKKLLKQKIIFKKSCVFFLFPILIFLLWTLFLKSYNKFLWSDWNFSGKNNLFSTLMSNVFSLKLFNKYAYQNWLHLFILNFNWIFWLVIGAGFINTIKNISLKKYFSTVPNNNQQRVILVIAIFFILYFFLILSYQTFAIPRYMLPLLPFVYLSFSSFLRQIFHNIHYLNKIIFFFLLIFIPLTLFTSKDPLSKYLWGKEYILGVEIYNIRNHLSGNDGITYNFQYLLITKKRDNLIKRAAYENGVVGSDECFFIFADQRNDIKTIRILGLGINQDILCKSKFY